MSTVNVPAGAPNRISGRGGSAYPTRERGGRIVVDLPQHDLDALLSGPQGKN